MQVFKFKKLLLERVCDAIDIICKKQAQIKHRYVKSVSTTRILICILLLNISL
jgi:hypothetical protein